MKWITGEKPKIDRIACLWLIKSFVNQQAEFIFTLKEEIFAIAKKLDAIPYDIQKAEYSLEGNFCTFDFNVKKHTINDPVVNQIAVIVRGADKNSLERAPEAGGLWAISAGLSHLYTDDYEQPFIGMKLYDALYH